MPTKTAINGLRRHLVHHRAKHRRGSGDDHTCPGRRIGNSRLALHRVADDVLREIRGKTYVTISMKYGLRANSNKAQERPGSDIAPPVPAT